MTHQDGDLSSQRRLAPIIGLVGAGLAAVLGMAAPHDGALWRVPRVLEGRVATALLTSGYAGLDVEMDGQHVILRGIVEDEADIARAQGVALRSAGAGGAWAGGVTSVNVSALGVGAFERPYVWSVRRDRKSVV